MLNLFLAESGRAALVIWRSPFETIVSLIFIAVLAGLMIFGVTSMTPGAALTGSLTGFFLWMAIAGFVSGGINDVADDKEAGTLAHVIVHGRNPALILAVRTLVHGLTGVVYGVLLMAPFAFLSTASMSSCAGATFIMLGLAWGGGIILAGAGMVLPKSRVIVSLASFVMLPLLIYAGGSGTPIAELFGSEVCASASSGSLLSAAHWIAIIVGWLALSLVVCGALAKLAKKNGRAFR